MNADRISMPEDAVYVSTQIVLDDDNRHVIRTLWEHKNGRGANGRASLDLTHQEAKKLKAGLDAALSHFA